jgi:hypothetical protein
MARSAVLLRRWQARPERRPVRPGALSVRSEAPVVQAVAIFAAESIVGVGDVPVE